MYQDQDSSMLRCVQAWVQRARREVDASFHTGPVPVALYGAFAVDNIGFPFRTVPTRSWLLHDAHWHEVPVAALTGVPYVAFCMHAEQRVATIQYGWAARFGGGFEIRFDLDGSTVAERMAWIS